MVARRRRGGLAALHHHEPGDRTASARLEIDGASEFASYDSAALRAAIPEDDEEETVLALIRPKPVRLDPGEVYSGTVREDDFDEAALDLDAIGRFMATPAAVLVNRSDTSPVGLEMIPPDHILPALYHIQVLFSAGHAHASRVPPPRPRRCAPAPARAGNAVRADPHRLPPDGAPVIRAGSAVVAATVLFLLLFLGADDARAQVMGEPVNPYPDPEKFARGLYVEAEAGAALFVGEARRSLGPGAALGLRFGYDIFRWVAVQLHATGSSHATDFGGTPQDGQLLQLMVGTAELKLTLPVGRWSVSGTVAGGIGRLSTNLLGTIGFAPPEARLTPLYGGGVGLDYHTASRHFSFGLTAGLARLTRVYTSGVLGSALYLRYTF